MTAAVFSPYCPQGRGASLGEIPTQTVFPAGNLPGGKGETTWAAPKKQKTRQQIHAAAAVFLRQKPPDARTCGVRRSNRFSRYPDLRIRSPPRSSRRGKPQPMTGFRLPGGLHAYSGGTVREFHPIPYSPSRPNPAGKALKLLFTFANHLTTAIPQCQQKKQPLFT